MWLSTGKKNSQSDLNNRSGRTSREYDKPASSLKRGRDNQSREEDDIALSVSEKPSPAKKSRSGSCVNRLQKKDESDDDFVIIDLFSSDEKEKPSDWKSKSVHKHGSENSSQTQKEVGTKTSAPLSQVSPIYNSSSIFRKFQRHSDVNEHDKHGPSKASCSGKRPDQNETSVFTQDVHSADLPLLSRPRRRKATSSQSSQGSQSARRHGDDASSVSRVIGNIVPEQGVISSSDSDEPLDMKMKKKQSVAPPKSHTTKAVKRKEQTSSSSDFVIVETDEESSSDERLTKYEKNAKSSFLTIENRGPTDKCKNEANNNKLIHNVKSRQTGGSKMTLDGFKKRKKRSFQLCTSDSDSDSLLQSSPLEPQSGRKQLSGSQKKPSTASLKSEVVDSGDSDISCHTTQSTDSCPCSSPNLTFSLSTREISNCSTKQRTDAETLKTGLFNPQRPSELRSYNIARSSNLKVSQILKEKLQKCASALVKQKSEQRTLQDDSTQEYTYEDRSITAMPEKENFSTSMHENNEKNSSHLDKEGTDDELTQAPDDYDVEGHDISLINSDDDDLTRPLSQSVDVDDDDLTQGYGEPPHLSLAGPSLQKRPSIQNARSSLAEPPILTQQMSKPSLLTKHSSGSTIIYEMSNLPTDNDQDALLVQEKCKLTLDSRTSSASTQIYDSVNFCGKGTDTNKYEVNSTNIPKRKTSRSVSQSSNDSTASDNSLLLKPVSQIQCCVHSSDSETKGTEVNEANKKERVKELAMTKEDALPIEKTTNNIGVKTTTVSHTTVFVKPNVDLIKDIKQEKEDAIVNLPFNPPCYTQEEDVVFVYDSSDDEAMNDLSQSVVRSDLFPDYDSMSDLFDHSDSEFFDMDDSKEEMTIIDLGEEPAKESDEERNPFDHLGESDSDDNRQVMVSKRPRQGSLDKKQQTFNFESDSGDDLAGETEAKDDVIDISSDKDEPKDMHCQSPCTSGHESFDNDQCNDLYASADMSEVDCDTKNYVPSNYKRTHRKEVKLVSSDNAINTSSEMELIFSDADVENEIQPRTHKSMRLPQVSVFAAMKGNASHSDQKIAENVQSFDVSTSDDEMYMAATQIEDSLTTDENVNKSSVSGSHVVAAVEGKQKRKTASVRSFAGSSVTEFKTPFRVGSSSRPTGTVENIFDVATQIDESAIAHQGPSKTSTPIPSVGRKRSIFENKMNFPKKINIPNQFEDSRIGFGDATSSKTGDTRSSKSLDVVLGNSDDEVDDSALLKALDDLEETSLSYLENNQQASFSTATQVDPESLRKQNVASSLEDPSKTRLYSAATLIDDPFALATQVDVECKQGQNTGSNSGNDARLRVISASTLGDESFESGEPDPFEAATQVDTVRSRKTKDSEDNARFKMYSAATQIDLKSVDDYEQPIDVSDRDPFGVMTQVDDVVEVDLPSMDKESKERTSAADACGRQSKATQKMMLIKSKSLQKKSILIPVQRDLKKSETVHKKAKTTAGSSTLSFYKSGSDNKSAWLSKKNVPAQTKQPVKTVNKKKTNLKKNDTFSLTQKIQMAKQKKKERAAKDFVDPSVPTAKMKHAALHSSNSDVVAPDEKEIMAKGLPLLTFNKLVDKKRLDGAKEEETPIPDKSSGAGMSVSVSKTLTSSTSSSALRTASRSAGSKHSTSSSKSSTLKNSSLSTKSSSGSSKALKKSSRNSSTSSRSHDSSRTNASSAKVSRDSSKNNSYSSKTSAGSMKSPRDSSKIGSSSSKSHDYSKTSSSTSKVSIDSAKKIHSTSRSSPKYPSKTMDKVSQSTKVLNTSKLSSRSSAEGKNHPLPSSSLGKRHYSQKSQSDSSKSSTKSKTTSNKPSKSSASSSTETKLVGSKHPCSVKRKDLLCVIDSSNSGSESAPVPSTNIVGPVVAVEKTNFDLSLFPLPAKGITKPVTAQAAVLDQDKPVSEPMETEEPPQTVPIVRAVSIGSDYVVERLSTPPSAAVSYQEDMMKMQDTDPRRTFQKGKEKVETRDPKLHPGQDQRKQSDQGQGKHQGQNHRQQTAQGREQQAAGYHELKQAQGHKLSIGHRQLPGQCQTMQPGQGQTMQPTQGQTLQPGQGHISAPSTSMQSSNLMMKTNKLLNPVQQKKPTFQRQPKKLPVETILPFSQMLRGAKEPQISSATTVPAEKTKFVADPSKLLESTYFLERVLRWNPAWLEEQNKPEFASHPPPILDLKTEPVYPLLESYTSLEDYQTIMTRLLLMETWDMIFKEWKQAKKKTVTKASLLCVEKCPSQDKGGVELQKYTWHSVLSKEHYRRGSYPFEGDLIVMNTWGAFLPSQKNKPPGSPELKTQFGYVDKMAVRRWDNIDNLFSTYPLLKLCVDNPRGELYFLTIHALVRYRRFKPSNDRPMTLESLCTLVPAKRQFSALTYLPRSPLLRDILHPTNSRVFQHDMKVQDKTIVQTYNQSQAEAISAVCRAVQEPKHIPRICLLQGPPGTGKTHTVTGIISKIIQETKGRCCLCLCTPSNGAADELMRRLISIKKSGGQNSAMRLVRFGKVNSIHSDVLAYAYDSLVDQERKKLMNHKKVNSSSLPESVRREKEQLQERINRMQKELESLSVSGNRIQVDRRRADLRKYERDLRYLDKQQSVPHEMVQLTPAEESQIKRRVLQDAHVICATLSSMGSNRIRNIIRTDNQRNPFLCAIIDEATQSTELDCLIPLQYGISKLVMVGDPEQLPPTVISQQAKDMKFGLSLFERLYTYFKNTDQKAVMMLRTQYRMDTEILTFPNLYVYDGLLNTDKSVMERARNFPLHPYVVFNIESGQEVTSNEGSVSNQVEADCVACLCQCFINRTKITADKIGVICPYQSQRALINASLAQKNVRDVEVGTVDGFQGREKHVIIMSCVRARSSDGSIGFVSDRRRMNVALTRAKYGLYVLGHLDTLKRGADWRALIDDAKRRNVIVNVPIPRDFISLTVRCLKTHKGVAVWQPTKPTDSRHMSS